MSVIIGIFEKEEQVMDAVRMLCEAGIEQEELRIVVNNMETAPILSAQKDVPIEELYGVQESQERQGAVGAPAAGFPAASGFALGGGPVGNGTGAVGLVPGRFGVDDDYSTRDILADFGIPSEAAETCSRAVESGLYLLAADSDAETNTENVLQYAGAKKVVS